MKPNNYMKWRRQLSEEIAAAARRPVTDIVISAEGLALLQQREGLVLRAYEDQGGTRTIGYGHTGGVKSGEYITIEQATKLLVADLNHVKLEMIHQITVPLLQCEFDALSSFIYNVGGAAFGRSDVLRYLNQGMWRDAAMHMTGWAKVAGAHNKGLWNRRKSEVRQFLANTRAI